VYTLWLAARTYGLGVGWVSILDPTDINSSLQVPQDWKLIAYLCIGHPEDEALNPELLRQGWESRSDVRELLFRR
jgi:5,6-dimethylbenzimidazole synthase